MNELLVKLNNEIRILAQAYNSSSSSNELIDELTNNIIAAAIEVYKDETIKFYVPCFEDGIEAILRVEDKTFMPIFYETNSVNDASIKDFKVTTLKQICSDLYENITTYSGLDAMNKNLDTEYLISHFHEITQMKEYAKNNPRIDGVVYEPYTNHSFIFEGWQIQAIMFKAMGATSFTTFNLETGDKIHEV